MAGTLDQKVWDPLSLLFVGSLTFIFPSKLITQRGRRARAIVLSRDRQTDRHTNTHTLTHSHIHTQTHAPITLSHTLTHTHTNTYTYHSHTHTHIHAYTPFIAIATFYLFSSLFCRLNDAYHRICVRWISIPAWHFSSSVSRFFSYILLQNTFFPAFLCPP